MLQELSIKNFAIISDLNVSFDVGLNVLTGETGVGKSIIIDALNLVLGGRASADLIRKGSNTCEVNAIFNIKENELLKKLVRDLIDADFDKEEILLRRQLTTEGKNRCYIDSNIITLSILQSIGEKLIDIHGQHEHQTLLNAKEQLNALDNFADAISLKEEIASLFRDYRNQKAELDRLISLEGEKNRKIDLYQFEFEEINKANLVSGEEESLEEEYLLLTNVQELSILCSNIYEKLYEQENSVVDLLKSVQKDLKSLVQIDAKLEHLLESGQDSFFKLEDIGDQVREYKEKLSFDPNRLEEIMERKDMISKLKRKYGGNIEEILKYRENIEKELNLLVSYQESKDEIIKKIKKTEEELLKLAANLSNKRKAAAKILEQRIEKQLHDLSMEKVKFYIECTEQELNATGQDRIKFLIAPNVGEDLKPLASIASGGEISRIMLALKTVLAKADLIPCLIFDEIDVGISGGVAIKIGKKLAELSDIHQIISITHMPQIASFGSTHFYVDKVVQKGRTKTMVKKLASTERTKEVARMLGGKDVTALTLQHAEEMINQANK